MEINDFLTGNSKRVGDTVVTAKVARIDNEGTIWLCVDGYDVEVPASSNSVAIGNGDSVLARISNGVMTVTGNLSRPSTDDTKANAANDRAITAGIIADMASSDAAFANANASEAKTKAESAYNLAEQADENSGYFWYEAGKGAHVSDRERDLSGSHLDIKSNRMDIMQGNTPLASFVALNENNTAIIGNKTVFMTSSDFYSGSGIEGDAGIGFVNANGKKMIHLRADEVYIGGYLYDPDAYTVGTVTAYNSWTLGATSCRKNTATKHVQFATTISKTTSFTGGTPVKVATLPSGYRPQYTIPLRCANIGTGTSTAFWSGYVNTSGEVYVRRNTTATSESISNIRLGCTFYTA